MQINKTFMDALTGLRNLSNAIGTLDIPMKADKPGTLKQKKKTQKGAKHVVNPVFLGRNVLKVTHAKYRSTHRGATKVVPNYLKPSPKPRARNVGVRNVS